MLHRSIFAVNSLGILIGSETAVTVFKLRQATLSMRLIRTDHARSRAIMLELPDYTRHSHSIVPGGLDV
jgi:hypothetical protein